MKSFVSYLSMISMGVIASVVLANGTLGPQALLGAISATEPAPTSISPRPVPDAQAPALGRTVPELAAGADSTRDYAAASPTIKLDYASLILGLFIGVLLSSLASIPWSQIPRRIANWLVSNQANFGYGLLSIGFAALLIYY